MKLKACSELEMNEKWLLCGHEEATERELRENCSKYVKFMLEDMKKWMYYLDLIYSNNANQNPNKLLPK